MVPVDLPEDDALRVRGRGRAPGVLRHPGPHARAVAADDPPGDGRPARRRVRARSGRSPIVNRLTEGTTFGERRPAPARDARQPGRGRPRERPARAVAGRAEPAQGAAPLPGLSRSADRTCRTGRCSPSRSPRSSARPASRTGSRSSCSSTSTTSRSSTTRSATPPATSSCVAVAERIQATVRESDLAARLGGDEFAILRRRPARPAPLDRGRPADDRRARGAVPDRSARRRVVGVSVGIAMARSDMRPGIVDGADDMLRNADVAMYTAKAAGKRRVRRSSSRRCTPRSSPATSCRRSWRGASPAASWSSTTSRSSRLDSGADRRASRRSSAGATRPAG